jgi:hypothetical protein
MAKAKRPVLLIGGVPGSSAEDVFRTVGPALGDIAIGLTDGEQGVRRFWIMFVELNTWAKHPDLYVVRPLVERGPPPLPDWLPAGYHAFRWWGVKPGIDRLSRIDTLGYPADAAPSYALFRRLRDQGVIPKGVRFQQSMPFPDDAVRLFVNDARTMRLMVDAYVDALKRDAARLCEQIPHEDLVIQWDINWETIAIEYGDHLPDAPPMQFKPHGDPMARFEHYVRELNSAVPADVPLGMHLCYGDLNHEHFRDPADLATSVAMTNAATRVSPRPINFVQMSVPRPRSDDRFFEPLRDLQMGDATLYAGLVHYTDGVEGSINRLNTLKRHFTGPIGVSTECGMGRRPRNQVLSRLLEIHREVAAAI